MSDRALKRIRYLGLAIEHGTGNVPDDGRYYITRHGEVVSSASNFTIAEAQLEIAEEEILAENPNIKNPRDFINKERGFNDIISVRGASRAAARTKAQQKGGKGGRSGV